MNRFFKYVLIVLGLNLLSILIFCLPVFFPHSGQYDALGWLIIGFCLTALSLVIQFIVALVYIGGEKKKELGQAMLLVVGLFLLIGLSVCSPLF